jgi:7-cyano-7-deazaguanine reductase
VTNVLKHLGKTSNDPVDTLDLIPWEGGAIQVTLDATEFTSHCPVTDQPDFGTLEISYAPRASIAETKSVKLYLRRYRDLRAFNEVIVDRVCDDFFQQLSPSWVRVVGRFNPRGGIAVYVDARRDA